MPRIQVFTHHTGRLLGSIDVTETQSAFLSRPPPLTPKYEDGPGGQKVPVYRPEDHAVRVGDVVLFNARVSGVDRVVSNTHQAVVASRVG